MPEIHRFEEASTDLLRLVIETGRIGVWKLDLETGEAWRNHRHDEIFGYDEPLSEWTYEIFLDHVFDEDRPRVDKLQRDAISERKEWLFECRIRAANGDYRWISAAGRPLIGENGETTTLIGHVVDITETKRNEERLAMVTQELNHRIRNMLATIRAVMRFSASGASDVGEFEEKLSRRIEALARAHTMLVGEVDEGLSLPDLIDGELEAFGGLADRVTFHSKERIFLTAAQVQPIALILHELLTNAIKYGALSNSEGQVAIAASEKAGKIEIEWKEEGGPPVGPIDETGFGTRVISGALGQLGSVKTIYAPGGLISTITLKATSS